MHLVQITDCVVHHGEGPMWTARQGRTRWVDVSAEGVLDEVVGQRGRQFFG